MENMDQQWKLISNVTSGYDFGVGVLNFGGDFWNKTLLPENQILKKLFIFSFTLCFIAG